MTKISMPASVLALALVTGCASTSQTSSTAPAAAPQTAAAPTPAAPLAKPLGVPAASTRKVVLNMTGPATVTQAKDWPAFQEEWRSTFAEHAKDAGIAFDMKSSKTVAEPGTVLNVYVNDYRMVGIGARIFIGVMTGNAYIDGKVGFADLGSGQAFGEREYNTSSSAWAGIFAKMTPQQVDSIASQVFAELKTR